MLAGVTVEDPATTYVDWGVEVGRDTAHPRRHPPARTHHHRRRLRDRPGRLPARRLRRRPRPRHQLQPVRSASSAPAATSGPFAYIRPNTVLAEGAKAGTFVEIKNSRIGEGSKVPHLSYVGDAIVGRDSNIAAGNITANYDGFEKHPTHHRRQRAHRQRHHARGAGHRRRRRLHGRRLGDHPRRAAGRAGRRARPAGERRGLRRAPRRPAALARAGGARASAEARRSGAALVQCPVRPESDHGRGRTVADSSCCVTSPRRSGSWCSRGAATRSSRRRSPRSWASSSAACSSRRSPTARSTCATWRASAAPTSSSSSPPCRPVNDKLMELLIMIQAAKLASAQPRHRGHALLRLLAAGQEERRARAHHRAARGRPAARPPASTA